MSIQSKRAPTLQDRMKEARDLEESIAVRQALCGYLRTKYLPTDSRQNPFQMDCKGFPVSVGSIQAFMDQMAAEAVEIQDELNALMKEVV